MAKDYAKWFYKSTEWLKCRDGFLKSRHYVCERCGGLAVIVHHKEHITPENVNDPNVTLNWDNLMAVCEACHNYIHYGSDVCAEGLSFDENGNITKICTPRSSAAG